MFCFLISTVVSTYILDCSLVTAILNLAVYIFLSQIKLNIKHYIISIVTIVKLTLLWLGILGGK